MFSQENRFHATTASLHNLFGTLKDNVKEDKNSHVFLLSCIQTNRKAKNGKAVEHHVTVIMALGIRYLKTLSFQWGEKKVRGQSLTVQPWLSLNPRCRPDWPQTHGNLPTTASVHLGSLLYNLTDAQDSSKNTIILFCLFVCFCFVCFEKGSHIAQGWPSN